MKHRVNKVEREAVLPIIRQGIQLDMRNTEIAELVRAQGYKHWTTETVARHVHRYGLRSTLSRLNGLAQIKQTSEQIANLLLRINMDSGLRLRLVKAVHEHQSTQNKS